ncbi:MAG: AAA family ATPase [Alphaproteobacteria bacterium]|jgi:DNA polymerase-3 subunit delta'|nr:AAA family ATPase [Alphaproteobacteria bacterium]
MANINSRNNPNLLGHSKNEELFLKLFNSGRMPHSIILSGQKGVGKETFAFRVARFLFASQNNWVKDFSTMSLEEGNPVFEKMEVGGFTDLKLVEREVNAKTGKRANVIKVEQVREIVEFFQTSSSEGGWRVVIIDEMEAMNQNAANALLKTLEEPPVKTLFLLVCNNIDAVMDTIKSRCRIMNFSDLDDDIVFDVVKQLKPLIDDESIRDSIYFNKGSVGKAIEFIECGGIEILEEMKSIFSALSIGRRDSLISFAGKVARKADDFDVFKNLYFALLYDLIRFGESKKFTLSVSCELENVFELKDRFEKFFVLEKSVNLEAQSIIIMALEEVFDVCR